MTFDEYLKQSLENDEKLRDEYNSLKSKYEELCKDIMDKQIPRKAIIYGIRVYYTCPSCHKHIGRHNYCKHCGQALDWSE